MIISLLNLINLFPSYITKWKKEIEHISENYKIFDNDVPMVLSDE